ncbi:hypothetical protein PV326_001154 [Microctonus aethiopoides]|nr:hypothetical protein PV326_001154 [Microctonus aethiopoides]
MSPRQVKYIFDLDGFSINKKFVCKEAAGVNIFTGQRFLRFYNVSDIPVQYEDWRGIKFVSRYIHGLKFEDMNGDLDQDDLIELIEDMCRDADHGGWLIGYKGGHVEKDLLNKLGYGHLGVNIEDFGCPKFENLLQQYPKWMENCPLPCNRHHSVIDKKTGIIKTAHCALTECVMFAKYIYSLTH